METQLQPSKNGELKKEAEKRFFDELKQKILYNYFAKFQMYEFQISKEVIEHHLKTPPNVVKRDEAKWINYPFVYEYNKTICEFEQSADEYLMATRQETFWDKKGNEITTTVPELRFIRKTKNTSGKIGEMFIIIHKLLYIFYSEETSNIEFIPSPQYIYCKGIRDMNTSRKLINTKTNEPLQLYILNPLIVLNKSLEEEK